jgi:hypothetical protein
MPVVTKYPTAVQAAGGVFNGSWTGAVSTVQSDNAVYATAAPGKNQEYASVFEVPFTTGEVPSGATINSALVEIQVKCSTTSSIGIVTSSLFADSAQATAIGAVPGVQTPATEPTVDTTFSFTRNPTEAEIRDLWVRVQGTRGNNNTALTWSLDFVRVTVNYTDPPPGFTGTGSGTGSASTGTGSAAEAFRAVGAALAASSTTSGTGGQRFIGSGVGAAATSTGTASGVVTSLGFSGSGVSTGPASTSSGQGALTFRASGSGTSASSAAGGVGSLTFTSSGTGSSAASTASGSGLLELIASGAGASAASTSAGAGLFGSGFIGMGAGSTAAGSGAGVGSVTAAEPPSRGRILRRWRPGIRLGRQ